METYVRITVTCKSCDQIIGTFANEIAEKYPFDCERCGDLRHDKYPWVITTEVRNVIKK